MKVSDARRLSALLRTSFVPMRHTSLGLRLARALLAFSTVWCLGCSSYEVILASILGARVATTMMTCGGEDSAASTMTEIGAHDTATAMTSVAASGGAHGFDCGCGNSCHAPSVQAAVSNASRGPLPSDGPAAPTAPASITRAPLLPPPERPIRWA